MAQPPIPMSHDRGPPPFSIGLTAGLGTTSSASREATPNLLCGPNTDPPTAIHTPTCNVDSRVDSTGSLLGHVAVAIKAEPVDPSPQPIVPSRFSFSGGLGQVDPDQVPSHGTPSQIQATGQIPHMPERGVWLGEVTGDPRIQLRRQSVGPHPDTAPSLGPYPYGPPPFQLPTGYFPYLTAPMTAGQIDPTDTQQPQTSDHLPLDHFGLSASHPYHPDSYLPRPPDCLPQQALNRSAQPHHPLSQHDHHPGHMPTQSALAGPSHSGRTSMRPHSSHAADPSNYEALERELARLRGENHRLQRQYDEAANQVEGWTMEAAEAALLARIRERQGEADAEAASFGKRPLSKARTKDKEIRRLQKLVTDLESEAEMWQVLHAKQLDLPPNGERIRANDAELSESERKRRRAGARAGAHSSAGGKGRESGGGELGDQDGHGGGSGTGGDDD